MTNAADICKQAAELVAGERDRQHGKKLENHKNIARLWHTYLRKRIDYISEHDVAMLMCLLKIARTQTGDHNVDDYIDLAGYAGCAGEIAEESLVKLGSFGDIKAIDILNNKDNGKVDDAMREHAKNVTDALFGKGPDGAG